MDEKIITLTVTGTGSDLQIEYRAGGSSRTDGVSLDTLDSAKLIAFARNAMEGYATMAEAMKLGGSLYAFLVSDRSWHADFSRDLESRTNLHLVLDMRIAALNTIPWELMYYGNFLALMPQLRFSRLGNPDVSMHPLSSPTQVVLVTSAIPEFGSEQEADAIFQALDTSQRSGQIYARQIRYQSPASLTQIPRCDILHISGHVELMDGGPVLIMDRQQGVPLSQLVDICKRVQPALVFINACNGAAVLPDRTKPSPVHLLHHEAGVPAVLGPFGITTVWGATTFAVEFYYSLVSGLTIAASVARARRQLFQGLQRKGHRGHMFDWLSMVLYQSQIKARILINPAAMQSQTAIQPQMMTQAQTAMQSQTSLESTPLPILPAQDIVFSIPKTPAEGERASLETAATDLDDQGSTETQIQENQFPLSLVSPESTQETTHELFVQTVEQSRTLPGETNVAQSALSADFQVPLPPQADQDGLAEIRAWLREHVAGQKTLGALQAAMNGSERRQRIAAVETIGLLAEQQSAARNILIDSASNPQGAGADPIVRRMAVEQLGNIQHPEATDALLVAMADPVQDVRQAAERALIQAKQNMSTESSSVRVSLPLTSAKATAWVVPLRHAMSPLTLAPRRRIEMMEHIERLRFELICPKPRVNRIESALDTLGNLSPQIKNLAVEIKSRIEYETPLQDHEGGE